MMKTVHYEEWIKSHQVERSEIDLSDNVMDRIIGKISKPTMCERTWGIWLQDMMQAKLSVRVGVLASGVLVGWLRIVTQIYMLFV